MSLTWTDVLDIAIELAESKPEVDPRYLNFVDLHRWVLELPDFADDPQLPAQGVGTVLLHGQHGGHPGQARQAAAPAIVHLESRK